MAVVRRRREEQPVFETGSDPPQHLAQLAVVAEGRGHQVVAFVDNQEVPGKPGRSVGRLAGGQELLLDVRLAQVVVGGDDAAEGAPGVCVDAEFAAQPLRPVAVDDLEWQGELGVEFLAPLHAQCRRRQDEHPADASAQQELLQDEPGFDGLAEPDIVGDEQIHPRHLQRA